MLEPKVRLLIGWFPFKTEAYARAKNILMSKYGKVSEIVNAHIQAMMALPTVHDSNLIRIYELYEKLLTHVLSLEIMGKLNTIEKYVRSTLDKLPQTIRLGKTWWCVATFGCIKIMGREKSYNKNRERKSSNSRRQEFQHTSTKCHKSEVGAMLQYRAQDKWLCGSERSSKT